MSDVVNAYQQQSGYVNPQQMPGGFLSGAYPQQQPMMQQPFYQQPPQVAQVQGMYQQQPPAFMQPMNGYATPAPLMPGAGFQYAQQAKPVAMTNPLKDIPRRLKEDVRKKLNITQEELEQAICTHRDATKLHLRNTNNEDNPSEFVCEICGAIFTMVENVSPVQVHNAVADVINLLQTMKVMWPDIPDQVCKDIFQIIAVLMHIDKLWTIACEQFSKMADPWHIGDISQDANANVFPAYNSLVANGAYQQPFLQAQQPMMMPQQPIYQQQQMNMVAQPQGQQPVGAPAPQINITAGPIGQPMMPQQQQVAQPMNMNLQQQAMMAQAPGVESNGFGYTAPIANLTPNVPVAQTQGVDPNGAQIPADAPKVTKTLQA